MRLSCVAAAAATTAISCLSLPLSFFFLTFFKELSITSSLPPTRSLSLFPFEFIIRIIGEWAKDAISERSARTPQRP